MQKVVIQLIPTAYDLILKCVKSREGKDILLYGGQVADTNGLSLMANTNTSCGLTMLSCTAIPQLVPITCDLMLS